MKKWYKLDNAAKIFPSVSNKRRTNVFRLSFVLKEEIDPAILKEAAEVTVNRFPSIKVKLKKGLFWYYLEENNEKPLVFEESPFICEQFNRKENNGYLFKLLYFRRRITIEVFHSLTDGTGALELLKSIVYNYLLLKGYEIDSENMILTDVESIHEESQDSFIKNYDARVKVNPREKKALQMKGTNYDRNWLSLIVGTIDVDKLKEVCAKYQATITEFLTACIIYSATNCLPLFEKKKKPFQVFVPVNLRKFFPSKTLRNFSLYIATGIDLDKKTSFDEIIKNVKEDFNKELKKERLHPRIVANVYIEKNIFMRIVPLMIKEIVLRIGYNAWGDKANTLTFSNLGKIDLPSSMYQYIESAIFSNGASSSINVGAISLENKLSIAFTSSIVERDLQKEFFRLLASYGLDITIETNELEV